MKILLFIKFKLVNGFVYGVAQYRDLRGYRVFTIKDELFTLKAFLFIFVIKAKNYMCVFGFPDPT